MIETIELCLTVGARKDPERSFSLKDVTLTVSEGEYFVLLGKSGSGKTLLLETLCGLNRVDSGCIRIREQDVTHLEPRFRGIGYLPQDYCLFPHQTIVGNVAYGLWKPGDLPWTIVDTMTVTLCGIPWLVYRSLMMVLHALERRKQAGPLLGQFGLAHLADRYPDRLSGGEKQRVSLVRALANQPSVLLLDEPVSAVDEQTRDALCSQLKSFQKEFGTTTIHVCHNFDEMLQVADRVAVMDQGRIVQTGTPQQILECPATLAVARLSQPGNLFVESIVFENRSDGAWLRLPGGVTIPTIKDNNARGKGKASVMIREENIRVLPETVDGANDAMVGIPAVVTQMADMGALVRLTARCNEQLALTVTQSKSEYKTLAPRVGSRVRLAIAPEDVHVIPG